MKNTLGRLLLIEDDVQLADALCAYLELKHYQVTVASFAQEAYNLVLNQTFDLIILDLSLPDEDGLVLLRKIRGRIEIPIIVTSGRNDTTDRIAGLEFGADDYLGKPFATRELELRVHHLLAKIKADDNTEVKALPIGPHKLDLSLKMLISESNEHITLTPTEYSILRVLGAQPGRVFSREQIIDELHCFEGPENCSAIDISICRLRKKIENDPKTPSVIVTVKGFGYCLGPNLPQ